jgi:hypothetical protein
MSMYHEWVELLAVAGSDAMAGVSRVLTEIEIRVMSYMAMT